MATLRAHFQQLSAWRNQPAAAFLLHLTLLRPSPAPLHVLTPRFSIWPLRNPCFRPVTVLAVRRRRAGACGRRWRALTPACPHFSAGNHPRVPICSFLGFLARSSIAFSACVCTCRLPTEALHMQLTSRLPFESA